MFSFPRAGLWCANLRRPDDELKRSGRFIAVNLSPLPKNQRILKFNTDSEAEIEEDDDHDEEDEDLEEDEDIEEEDSDGAEEDSGDETADEREGDT